MADVTDVISAWVMAVNARDVNTIRRLYAPDAQITYGWGELVSGADAIEQHFDAFFQAFPDWSKRPFAAVFGREDWAALEWKAEATFLGRYEDAAPTGRRFRLRGCGVFHVVNERIEVHRRYFDRRSWYQQMGLRN